MTTLTKIIVGLLLSFLLSSCQFGNGFGIKGNGNIETVKRNINEDFNEIKVSRGLDVYLTQDTTVSLQIEADENLHDIIMTKVEDNVLKIYSDQNINSSKAKKVTLSFNDIHKISAHSGSEVYSTNTIKVDQLELNTTSGSDMEIDIIVNNLKCNSNSGSDLRVSGLANTLYANATSGSDIKAGKLKVKICHANASSGADIIVNTSDTLYAKANSGGDIKYYGTPNKIDKTNGVSRKIQKQ